MNYFERLNSIDVSEHIEKKNGLSYLSWAWAWAEFCKVYPTAEYEVYKNEQGLPYVYDENTGYMVYVTVRVEEDGKVLEHEMWLPVMDNQNNAMKSSPYVKKTKYKEVTVDSATMFDINKTIMRCLVKCLAIFGFGLYIYAGEDLPENAPRLTREETINKLKAMANMKNMTEEQICGLSKKPIKSIEEMTDEQLSACMEWLKGQE